MDLLRQGREGMLVLPGHPLAWGFQDLIGVAQEGRQVVEGIGAHELAGGNKAHKEVPYPCPSEGLDLFRQFLEELYLLGWDFEIPHECLKFMRIQVRALGPVAKATRGEAFVSEPEALTVIGEEHDGRSAPAVKDKKSPIKGIQSQDLTTAALTQGGPP